MKKLIAGILALTMIASLTACGSQGTSDVLLNKTIEIPDGSLSFMINESWMIEEEAMGDEHGVIRPLANQEGIKLVYGKTSFGAVSGEPQPEAFYKDILERLETLSSDMRNFEVLKTDSSLEAYYYSAFSYEWNQENYGDCRVFNVFLLSSREINSVRLRIPLSMIDEWENTAIELIESVRALQGAETKDDLTLSPENGSTTGSDSIASGRYRLSYAGKILTVELDENPTTGYEWHLSTDNQNVVFADDEYIPSPSNPEAVGTGGLHVYRFEGAEEGKTTITFESFRPGYSESVSEQVLIVVEVMSDGSIENASFESSRVS